MRPITLNVLIGAHSHPLEVFDVCAHAQGEFGGNFDVYLRGEPAVLKACPGELVLELSSGEKARCIAEGSDSNGFGLTFFDQAMADSGKGPSTIRLLWGKTGGPWDLPCRKVAEDQESVPSEPAPHVTAPARPDIGPLILTRHERQVWIETRMSHYRHWAGTLGLAVIAALLAAGATKSEILAPILALVMVASLLNILIPAPLLSFDRATREFRSRFAWHLPPVPRQITSGTPVGLEKSPRFIVKRTLSSVHRNGSSTATGVVYWLALESRPKPVDLFVFNSRERAEAAADQLSAILADGAS